MEYSSEPARPAADNETDDRVPAVDSPRQTSSGRMLDLLGLFTTASPLLSAERLVASSGVSSATLYRYVADLCAAGLLARRARNYGLGHRIAELDHLLRSSDPLVRAAQPIMREVRDKTGLELTLFEMFQDQVIAAHRERGAQPTTLVFERGCPAPLLFGSAPKAILSSLPASRLRQLHRDHQAAIAQAGLGLDWPSFQATMAATRRAGYAISVGEITPEIVGVAAPIAGPKGAPPGAIAATITEAQWQVADRAMVANQVMQAASRIGKAMAR